MSRKSLHYTGLVGAIALGAILRWWHLDLKPLWMDEVITAIFSLGKNYHDLPMEVVFPGAQLREIFTWKPGVSCAQIAQNIANQSTHPPLFFCGMHSWLGWMSLGKDWVAMRSLSALYGVGAIAVIYFVNRIAFSPTAGIMAAVLMAGSPFAVYLSQEARHYTLPMLLISLALLGLVQIQRDIEQRQIVRFPVWLFWAIINSIGLYVHYFFVIAFIAQIATLITTQYRMLGLQLRRLPAREGRGRKIWLALILSVSGVALSFLPWLAIVLNHFNRSETNWLDKPNHIAPLYHTLIGWVLMVITLPVENQPLSIKVISGLLMLLFSAWVGWQVFKGIKQLLSTPSTHLSTLTLLSFSGWVLLEFFALVYLSNKDITTVPRYNFVYYPSFCALIAASFCQRQNNGVRRRNSFLILVLVSVLSSIFVISNLVFQKPFQPERVAQNMNLEPTTPLMVVVGYRDYQDVALGLSFALALEPLRETKGTTNFAFFKQSPNFQSVWQKLSQLPTPKTSKLNLWVVGPGRRRRDYPQQVAVSSQTTCNIDTQQHYRIGVPYQLYRCGDFRF